MHLTSMYYVNSSSAVFKSIPKSGSPNVRTDIKAYQHKFAELHAYSLGGFLQIVVIIL